MITIDDFPEISSLNEDDKLIVFSKNVDGTMTPHIEDLSSAIKLGISRSLFFELSSKYEELEKAELSLEKELSSIYVTNSFISSIYSTKEYFNNTTNLLKKAGELEADLKNKALKDYLETKYQNVLYQMQDLKRLLGTAGWTTDDEAIGYKITLAAKAKNPGE